MLGRSFEMLINSSDFNIGKHKFLALSRTNLSLERTNLFLNRINLSFEGD